MTVFLSNLLRQQCLSLFILAHVFRSAASPLEPEEIGSSPQIQDAFLNPPPRECPVLQDGLTTNPFAWTHPPTCLPLVIPSSTGTHAGLHQTFCVYTNTAFGNGRGISIVTSPSTASELSSEVWETGVDRSADPNRSSQWEAKETQGKGIGLFAKRTLESGETLILESPVLIVSREVSSSVSHSRRSTLLEKAVAQLPPKSRDLVMNLSRRGGESVIEDIINVNAIRAAVWDQTPHLLVVPEAARINHACRPNAYYRFNDATLTLDVFALRPISSNEEITFSYGFSFEPHEKRQKALEATWGFKCKCPLCNSNSTSRAASDTRVADIAGIKAALPTSLNDIPQYIAGLPRLISLLDEENLLTEMPMYEEILAYAWSAVKEEGRAKAWAERASAHWAIVAGRDSWEAKRSRELSADVKGHYTWGTWDDDIWEGVGQGHPWDEHDGEDHHHHHHH